MELIIIIVFITSIISNFFLYQQIKEFQVDLRKEFIKYRALQERYIEEIQQKRIYRNLNEVTREERDTYKQKYNYLNIKWNRLFSLRKK